MICEYAQMSVCGEQIVCNRMLFIAKTIREYAENIDNTRNKVVLAVRIARAQKRCCNV